MTTKRISEIDILYTFGAILAVFGHSHPNDWSVFDGTFLYHTINFIYTFHMPLFFLITGILLANSKSVERKPFGLFIKEKAFKLLTPYIVLSLLFIFPKGYIEHGNFQFLNVEYLIKVIFSPRHNVWGHFWFLPVLFVCYVIFGTFKKYILKNVKSAFALTAVTVLTFVMILLSKYTTDWFAIADIFKFAFYIPFGMLLLPWLKNHKQLNASLLIILALSPLLISGVLYAFLYRFIFAQFIISLLMFVSLSSAAKLIGEKFNGFFSYFGKNVFTVYIYSWPFQSIALMVLEKINPIWQINVILVFIVGIICPLAISVIYGKLQKMHCKFLDLLLGMR